MKHEPTPLSPALIAALRRQLRGSALEPGNLEYALERRVWNAAIDWHPGAIVLCADAADAALALRPDGSKYSGSWDY